MAEPRDPLETWLREPVRPLPPPPGALAQIQRRARRRKLRQVAISAAAAAVVVVAAAAAPGLIRAQFPSRPLASPRHTPARPPHQPTASPQRSVPSRAVAGRTPRTLAGFRPSSVTFIGTQTGWVLGQARAGQCLPQGGAVCTVLARTGDTGATWHAVGAPPAAAPDGAAGVSQVRFLNYQDGWVFGPQLWATHDRGRTWRQINTGGLRVTALETSGGRAFALWAACSGAGADFASRCTSYALYSTPANRDHWARVRGVPTLSTGSGPAAAALVLGATEGYLLGPSGVLLTGPVSGGGWHQAAGGRATPCAPGRAQPSGQPSGAMLATTGQGLLLLCAGPAAGGGQHKSLYYSPDAGQTWQPAGTALYGGVAQSVSGSPSGAFLVATDLGVDRSGNGGATWQSSSGPLPPGGFSYLGMTFTQQGVAVPADHGQHALWFTRDGGLSWQEYRIR